MKLMVNGIPMDVEAGKNALDLAGEISKDLKKEALVARLDGKVISLVTPINEDGGVLEEQDWTLACVPGGKMTHTARRVYYNIDH